MKNSGTKVSLLNQNRTKILRRAMKAQIKAETHSILTSTKAVQVLEVRKTAKSRSKKRREMQVMKTSTVKKNEMRWRKTAKTRRSRKV